MIGPIAPAPACRTDANRMSYPFSLMAGIRIAPTAAVSAVEDPEIPANTMEASTHTMARLPLSQPTQASANSTIFWDSPPSSIRFPANINSGIAMIGQLSSPVNMRCGTRTSGKFPSRIMEIVVPSPRPTAMGVPIRKKNRIPKNNVAIIPGITPFLSFCLCLRLRRPAKTAL